MTPETMESIVRSIGRIPRQRNTVYADVSEERYSASFMPRALASADVRARAKG
jgi:FO synthase